MHESYTCWFSNDGQNGSRSLNPRPRRSVPSRPFACLLLLKYRSRRVTQGRLLGDGTQRSRATVPGYGQARSPARPRDGDDYGL
jgi:hypothetical protein